MGICHRRQPLGIAVEIMGSMGDCMFFRWLPFTAHHNYPQILPIIYVLGFLFLPRQLEQERLGMDAPVSSTHFSSTAYEPTGFALGRSGVFVPVEYSKVDLTSSEAGKSGPVSFAEGIAEMREVQSPVPVTVVAIRRAQLARVLVV